MTYKIKGTSKYLTLVEAIGPARYYRAWIADRLDGEWRKFDGANTWETPFAGMNNVTFADHAVLHRGKEIPVWGTAADGDKITVRGDGSIDEKEVAVLEGTADWMDVNKQAIFSTRPWKVFGEGPASDGTPINAQGFNEGNGKPFTWEDVRFASKENVLYVIILDGPEGKELGIKSLGFDSSLLDGRKIKSVELLGSDKKVNWKQTKNCLNVAVPGKDVALLKIKGVLK